jgi:HAD superfamily hydrolase (TIGR01490 family)
VTDVAPRAAAFFDLDRTLIAGSSAYAFARAAGGAGLISHRQLARGAWANVRFRLRGSTDADTDALRERVLRSLAGVRVIDAMRLAPRLLDRLLPRLHEDVLALAHAHQDAGRPIYIVTAASQEVAELLASVLHFDGGVGSRSEVRDGAYTGRPEGPFIYREGKAQAVRELAAREGLDLEASFAYSDSESDLPLLGAVGHPVAVNPDSALARVARAEGWQVVRADHLGRRLAATATVAALAAGAAVVNRGVRRS